jgi:hypothetical protein
LEVISVTVKNSQGYGVLVDRMAGFTPDSNTLIITGCGLSDPSFPHPLKIDFHGLSTVPPGSYTGNLKDMIRVDTYGGTKPSINFDITVHDRGVPYHVRAGSINIHADKETDPVPTLTIESGVEIYIDSNGEFIFGTG